ncbi:MAG: TonB-dependent receptor [Chloracidobacterium sp.]|nr:TonB-dependent receptor [Chloracidobacterium sp.]
MKRDLRFVLTSLLFVALFAIVSFGQETTGGLEITTKDQAEAVVPGVAITVSSSGSTTGFRRTVTTNDEGFVRIIQIPPGTYTITAAAQQGFGEQKLTNVEIALGRTTSRTLTMSATQNIDVIVNNDAIAIDTTRSDVESSISARTAELLPKGTGFSSILKVTASTRPEARSGQFQIDGASGSENTFIIDGQEVTNLRTGVLDANSNIPFSQVQEVKVKSSGFEAEYGGATGGVIIVATKGGGPEFHGEFGTQFRSSKLEPIGAQILRTGSNGGPEWYPNRYSQYNETNPSGSVSGPILKNNLWFLGNYSPRIFTQSRTLVFLDGNRVPTGRVETYNFKQRTEAASGRLDASLFNKLGLMGKVSWNPVTQTGLLPGYSTELNNAYQSAAANSIRGGRQNSMSITGSGTYTATSNLIITGRLGHYFLNEKLGAYGIASIGPPRIVCTNIPFSSAQYPAGFGCVRASPNQDNGVIAVSNTEFDVTTRDQYDADATYSFQAGGRHELKGGFARSNIANDVIQGTTDQITLRSGSTGLATVGNYSGRSIPTTPGAIGSARLSTFKTRGNVASSNTAIYLQDGWQVTSRLRLNLGFRTEKEDVPSYAPGLPGMNFSFSDKITPRLGAAYALTSDGKTKVSAFYGLFFDRFKLELPRGSFGGDEFHDVFFELFPGDTLASLTAGGRDLIFGAGGGPVPGGACPLNTVTPVIGRVRCDVDFRVSSNSGGPLTEVGGIDPNIKPFTQREITFTFQRQLFKLYTFSARYTRKQVIHAIEDAGFPNSEGSEYYIIGNPGEGLYKEQADAFGTLAPKPQRDFDAVEFKFDRAYSNNFMFEANYTWSRLYGNYGGLASSDEEGRLSPNVNRYFDQPHAGFTAAGGPDNGLLATDRPHVFKFSGGYSLGWEKLGLWKSNTTDFGVFTTLQSGTLITSFVNINNIAQIILTKRGDLGRTPTFSQTDFSVSHNIKFGRDGRYALKFDADAINVFNQFIVTNRGLNPSGQGGNIINTTNFNPLDARFNLVSPADTAACAGSQQCLLIAAYKTFQVSGSPELVELATTGPGKNPFYNIDSANMAKRQLRYGIRFTF